MLVRCHDSNGKPWFSESPGASYGADRLVTESSHLRDQHSRMLHARPSIFYALGIEGNSIKFLLDLRPILP